MTNRWLLLLLAVSIALLTACHLDEWSDSKRFQEDFHHSYDFGPGGRLYVENLNGPIEIEGWDRQTVEISGAKYASTEKARDALRVDILASAASIRVRAVRPSGYGGNMGARFLIKAPRQTVLEKIRTSNGAIRVKNIEAEARLETSNGSVTVNELEGGLEARTSNGSIRLELPAWKNTDVDASTSNGSITLRLPDGAGAEVNARTSNGSISCDFDLAGGGTRKRTRLDGVIGAGGPKLTLKTSNGSIRIQRIG